jgi:hypothetical protein
VDVPLSEYHCGDFKWGENGFENLRGVSEAKVHDGVLVRAERWLRPTSGGRTRLGVLVLGGEWSATFGACASLGLQGSGS